MREFQILPYNSMEWLYFVYSILFCPAVAVCSTLLYSYRYERKTEKKLKKNSVSLRISNVFGWLCFVFLVSCFLSILHFIYMCIAHKHTHTSASARIACSYQNRFIFWTENFNSKHVPYMGPYRVLLLLLLWLTLFSPLMERE